MADSVIKIEHLSKDYGEGRGIFDINLDIKRGEVYGYIGTNGSGKTTTIRNLMGFIKPDGGNAQVLEFNSWKDSTKIMNHVSYVPGEIAFPGLASGTAFLKLQAEYLGITDFTYMNELIKMLQLDPSANLKRMSKGMKQKTALVAALMADKEILVLDEPTTGLDPLMRDAFLELIEREKEKGKTVFMSSHIFEEIETVCDKVSMLKDGKIVDTVSLWDIRHWKTKKFYVRFKNHEDFKDFTSSWKEISQKDEEKLECAVKIPSEDINQLFQKLKNYDINALREEHMTLEQLFLNVYGEK